MNSFRQILIQLGSEQEVGDYLGVSRGTVQAWKGRGSIPSPYWRRVLALAAEKGVGLDYDQLASLAEQKKKEGAQ